MSRYWGSWEFSPEIRDEIMEFTGKFRGQNPDSKIARIKKYLKFKKNDQSISAVAAMNETINATCDIDGLVNLTIETLESDANLDENKFNFLSTSQLIDVFTKVCQSLTASGFINFCKVLSVWKNVKLLNISFDHVILYKLQEKEEASTFTITALKELGKSKSEHVSKCMIKLVTNEAQNFTDSELLQQVFDVMSNSQKEDIIRAIMQKKNFNESDWQLLQGLSFKNESSLESIILFMNSKCNEYADSQTFARLLVHICQNLQSDKHKDILLSLIERNRTLLKHKAMKYLSGNCAKFSWK